MLLRLIKGIFSRLKLSRDFGEDRTKGRETGYLKGRGVHGVCSRENCRPSKYSVNSVLHSRKFSAEGRDE